MSMKIDGSNVQSLSCESEVQSCEAQPKTQSAAPVQQAACVDTLEHVRAEERSYAGERDATEQALYGVLKQVPQPGLAEYEVSINAMHAIGTKVTITAERDASGDFLIRLAGKGTAGVPLNHEVALEQRLEAGAAFRFRTPEAAADFLATAFDSSNPSQVLLKGGELATRAGHYASQNLASVDVSGEVGAHVSASLTVAYGALDLTDRTTAMVDLEKGALILQQGISGEALGRASIGLARAGVQGEWALKARTEIALPHEKLEALKSGELSLGQALEGVDYKWKLIGEWMGREEVGTLVGSPAAMQKLEVEFEPMELLHGDPKRAALHGEATTYTTKNKAYSTGVDIPGLNVLVRAAVYDVNKTPFFGHHDTAALQSELDGRRALTH